MMASTQDPNRSERDDERQPDSGLPGGGAGRRDEPGHTGVYPTSASEGADPSAPVADENAWGQGARGAAGYQDAGGSELTPPNVGDGTPASPNQSGRP